MPMRRFRIPTEIQQVHPHEDDQEPTQQRERILRSWSSETLEENKGSDDGCCGEEDVVHWVDDVGWEGVEGFVEVVHSDGRGELGEEDGWERGREMRA